MGEEQGTWILTGGLVGFAAFEIFYQVRAARSFLKEARGNEPIRSGLRMVGLGIGYPLWRTIPYLVLGVCLYFIDFDSESCGPPLAFLALFPIVLSGWLLVPAAAVIVAGTVKIFRPDFLTRYATQHGPTLLLVFPALAAFNQMVISDFTHHTVFWTVFFPALSAYHALVVYLLVFHFPDHFRPRAFFRVFLFYPFVPFLFWPLLRDHAFVSSALIGYLPVLLGALIEWPFLYYGAHPLRSARKKHLDSGRPQVCLATGTLIAAFHIFLAMAVL